MARPALIQSERLGLTVTTGETGLMCEGIGDTTIRRAEMHNKMLHAESRVGRFHNG